MWLSRKYTSAGLAEIGTYYGGRSHSTVVAAQKKINGLLESDATVQLRSRTTTDCHSTRKFRAASPECLSQHHDGISPQVR